MNGCGRSESRAVVFAERFGEQAACIRVPRKILIAKPLEGVEIGVEPFDRGRQGVSSVRGIEIVCKLEHRRVLERRLAVEIPACGEDEEGAAERRIPF
ncbi:hypothetical protein AYO48_04385 [Gaiella sp. SCGC AG-212-M14]|nr:hypothetical protein AYO48_04385 [Gaiella sp. SCGC AG-212-M14]